MYICTSDRITDILKLESKEAFNRTLKYGPKLRQYFLNTLTYVHMYIISLLIVSDLQHSQSEQRRIHQADGQIAVRNNTFFAWLELNVDFWARVAIFLLCQNRTYLPHYHKIPISNDHQNIPNGNIIDWNAVKYYKWSLNIQWSFQIYPKLGFFAWKYTIWQPCWALR
jgi:hypothetical protein